MTEALQLQAKAEAPSTVHARLPCTDNKLAWADGLQEFAALQRKPLATQPQLVQAKPLAGHAVNLAQRKAEPEEEEDETVQAKRSDGLIQREKAAEEEEEKVQAKLKIGPPDDEYEREADRVAEQVMSMPEPRAQRACPSCDENETVQTASLTTQITPLVQRQTEPEEEEEEKVQTKSLDGFIQLEEAAGEEEEEIQTKPLADQITSLLQRQAEPEEEEKEKVQAKRSDGQIQRQEAAGEEEEEIQAKPLAAQITPLLQRQAGPDDEEEEKLQAKRLDGLIQLHEEIEDEDEEIQAKPIAEQITPLMQRQTEPEEETLQTKQSISQTPRLVPRLGSSIHSMRGNGQALSQSECAFFEPRFGHDFSRVKVHTSSQAAKAAQAINAQAFTLGNDIFFGAGRYMPETSIGKGLLAHELVHVIQQREHDDLINRSRVDDRRKEIVDTALGLTEEHYLMGAAGQIPDKGGGVNARNVIMNSCNHAASIDVDYGKKRGGKKTHVCAGRSEKAAPLPQANPKNEEHHKNPSKYKWKRISDGSTVFGEACEGKNHFDCGGFISYCYKKVCPEVKYPGDVINLLSASYGWTKVDKEQVQPGDIAYREGQEHGHHAGLCISSDKVISALGKKWGVQSEPTSKYQKFGHLGCLKEQEEQKSGEIHRKELAYKSQPNNMYEQEAERMADQVMRMPELRVQRQVEPEEVEKEEKIQTKPLARQITSVVKWQAEPEENGETNLTKKANSYKFQVDPGLEARINSMRCGGQTISLSECAFIEPRFRHDFGQVRLHTDAQAGVPNITHHFSPILSRKIGDDKGKDAKSIFPPGVKGDVVDRVIKYRKEIEDACKGKDISPEMVMAIISKESQGKPNDMDDPPYGGPYFGLMQARDVKGIEKWKKPKVKKGSPEFNARVLEYQKDINQQIIDGIQTFVQKKKALTGMGFEFSDPLTEANLKDINIAYAAGEWVVNEAVNRAKNAGKENDWRDKEYMIPAVVRYGSFGRKKIVSKNTKGWTVERYKKELMSYGKLTEEDVNLICQNPDGTLDKSRMKLKLLDIIKKHRNGMIEWMKSKKKVAVTLQEIRAKDKWVYDCAEFKYTVLNPTGTYKTTMMDYRSYYEKIKTISPSKGIPGA